MKVCSTGFGQQDGGHKAAGGLGGQWRHCSTSGRAFGAPWGVRHFHATGTGQLMLICSRCFVVSR